MSVQHVIQSLRVIARRCPVALLACLTSGTIVVAPRRVTLRGSNCHVSDDENGRKNYRAFHSFTQLFVWPTHSRSDKTTLLSKFAAKIHNISARNERASVRELSELVSVSRRFSAPVRSLVS